MFSSALAFLVFLAAYCAGSAAYFIRKQGDPILIALSTGGAMSGGLITIIVAVSHTI